MDEYFVINHAAYVDHYFRTVSHIVVRGRHQVASYLEKQVPGLDKTEKYKVSRFLDQAKDGLVIVSELLPESEPDRYHTVTIARLTARPEI
jgi:hypothetical protein